MAEIEDCLTEYKVEIKNIKKPNKEETSDKGETVKIIGHYNKRGFKKNELLSKITSLEEVKEVTEAQNI